METLGISLAERGLVPDTLTRFGIRGLIKDRYREANAGDDAERRRRLDTFAQALIDGPIAIHQDAANAQHYMVPPAFYELCLGRHRKYSSCWFLPGDDLDTAEQRMLDLSIERADIIDGMRVLDIGCGWGSLSLEMARRFPASTIDALSNSSEQRHYIERKAASEGLGNIHVITADLAEWDTDQRYDRLTSVECLEHMRGYDRLFERFSRWLSADGKMFIHVFCHQHAAYPFETEGSDNWMGRHFFTGGIMPSFDLFRRFDSHLQVVRDWRVNGSHYAETSRAWLDRIDGNRDAVVALFARDLGQEEARRMYHRWRMFFMACEELFGFSGGDEWLVGHYLLQPVRS